MAKYNVAHATYDEFRAAVNGRAYNLDGLWGPQCWDGIELLYTQNDIGQHFITGNGVAKGCWLNANARAINGSGHFRQIISRTDIKRGDIIVFNTYSGWYGSTGHVAYADEDYNGSTMIRILGQNQGPGSGSQGTPFNIRNSYLGAAFLGAFRYDRWESTPPTPPTPTPQTKWQEEEFPWPIAWEHWGWK